MSCSIIVYKYIQSSRCKHSILSALCCKNLFKSSSEKYSYTVRIIRRAPRACSTTAGAVSLPCKVPVYLIPGTGRDYTSSTYACTGMLECSLLWYVRPCGGGCERLQMVSLARRLPGPRTETFPMTETQTCVVSSPT